MAHSLQCRRDSAGRPSDNRTFDRPTVTAAGPIRVTVRSCQARPGHTRKNTRDPVDSPGRGFPRVPISSGQITLSRVRLRVPSCSANRPGFTEYRMKQP
eukprot:767321-Hanusia_phi.AAC.7